MKRDLSLRQHVINNMKRVVFSGVSALLLVGGFSACSKSKINKTSDVLEDGNWKISQLYDDGVDHSAHMMDYTFDFNSDGTFTATKGTMVYNGTWSLDKKSDDDFIDDSPNVELNIFQSEVFSGIDSGSWELESRSDNKVVFGDDDSDDDDDNDRLTFVKI